MKMDRILLKMSGEALAGDKKHGLTRRQSEMCPIR